MAIRAALVGSAVWLSTAIVSTGGCSAVSGLDKDYTFGPDGGEVGDGAAGVDGASGDGAAEAGDAASPDAGHHGQDVCLDKSLSIANGLCTRCAQTSCCRQLQVACTTDVGCDAFISCFAGCPQGDVATGAGDFSPCVSGCVKAEPSADLTAFHDLAECLGRSARSGQCAAQCDFR